MLRFPHILAVLWMLALTAHASDSLNYSGRLVNANGSPVTGPVNLKFELVYTNAPGVAVCTKNVNGVALTNGVFHIRLDYLTAECGGSPLLSVIEDSPANETVAVKVTDMTNARVYSAQAIHAIPFSLMSQMSKQLVQMGATPGQVLAWDGAKWAPAAAGGGGGSGTVTSIIAGTGLSGGTITTSGTIGIANLGVDTAQLAASAVTDAKVSATAAIARTKLANGTASHVLVNDGSGVMSGVAQLPIAQGGTGAATAAAARTALGVMAFDAVPNCLATHKLQMSLGPTYTWSCVADALFDGGPVSAAIDMNSNKITELASPTVASDAANKAYVDAQVSGVAVTQWVDVAGGHIKYTGGRVGVGVDPTEALDVAANAKVAGNVLIDGKLKLKSDNANFVELQAPAGVAATRTFVWPGVYGTNGQVLTTDGAGALSWTTVSGGGGSNWTVTGSDVYRASGNVGIGTTTPGAQLHLSAGPLRINGVDLSVYGTQAQLSAGLVIGSSSTYAGYGLILNTANSGHGIGIRAPSASPASSTSFKVRDHGNTNDLFAVKGDGSMFAMGDVAIGHAAPTSKLDVKGELRLSGSTSGHVGFAPAAVAGSQTYTLPNADGTSGQMLTTNGSGVLSWTTSSGGATSVGGDLTGTVSNAQIAAGAVGTTEIADTSVTYAKTNFADGDVPQAKVNGLVAALTGKEPAFASGANTTYLRGDKTFQTLNTTAVAEGTNLYFLDSRVRDALLAGYTTGSALPLAAGDTLLQALGKLEGSIAAVQAGGQWTAGSGNVYRTTGNVGIGTNNPSTKLDVVSAGNQLRLTTGAAGADFIIDAQPNVYTMKEGSSASETIVLNKAAHFVSFGTNSAERMRIDTNGFVGVGVTSPAARLHLNGGIRIDRSENDATQRSVLETYRGDGSGGFGRFRSSGNGTNGVDKLHVDFNAADVMTWTSGGNVGIGTAAPTSKLQVQGDSMFDSTAISTSIGIGVWGDPLKLWSLKNSNGNFLIDGSGTSSVVMQVRVKGATPTIAAYETGLNIGTLYAGSYATYPPPANGLLVQGNVGIGTPTPASILDINSTTSGILIPRMTTAERDAIGGTKTGMQVYNVTTNQLNYHNGTSWQALGTAGAGISSLTAGTGLTGGTITTSGTVAVDVGTGNNQIVQLNGSAQLPAVSGANLTNLNPANLSAAVPLTKGGTGLTAGGTANQVLGMNAAGTAAEYKTFSATSPLVLTHGVGTAALTLNTVQTASGGTGVTSFTGTRIIGSNAAGTGLVSLSCSVGEVLTFNVSGDYICQSVSSMVSTGFINGGNSFAAAATIGTNDAYDLNLETNNTARMTILSGGNVGIGTTSPGGKLDVVASQGTQGIRLFSLQNGGVNPPHLSFFRSLSGGPSASARFQINGSNAQLGDYDGFYMSSPNSSVGWLGADTNAGTQNPTGANWLTSDVSNVIYALSRLYVADGTLVVGRDSGASTAAVGGLIRSGQKNGAVADVAGSNLDLRAGGGTGAGVPGDLLFSTANVLASSSTVQSYSTKMVVKSSGSVGIGTTTPYAKLDIRGDLGASPTPWDSTMFIGNLSENGRIIRIGFEDGTAVKSHIESGQVTGTNDSYMAFRVRNSTMLEAMRINYNGNVGIGTTTPAAVLHLKAGAAAANSAPLMFTAGTNLTTPVDGAMEFDGTNLYITTGGSRKTLSTSGGASNYVSSGTISTSNGTASTSTLTGAVVVAGGLGIGGDVNVGVSTTSPIVYGSRSASGNLTLDSNATGTKGNILLGTSGGKVGIGNSNPAADLHLGADNTNTRIYVSGDSSGANPLTTGRPTSDTSQVILGRGGTAAGGGLEFILSPSGLGFGYKIAAPNVGDDGLNFYTRWNSATWSTAMTLKGANGHLGLGTTTPRAPLHIKQSNFYNYPIIQGLGSGGTAFTSTDTIPVNGNGLIGYGGLLLMPDRWGNASLVDSHNALYIAGTQRNTDGIAGSLAFGNWGYFTGTGTAAGELGNAIAQGDAVKFKYELHDAGSAFSQRLDLVTRSATNSNYTAMSVLSSGNIGMGTTTPKDKLDVRGNIMSTGGFMQNLYFDGAWKSTIGGYGSYWSFDKTTGMQYFWNTPASAGGDAAQTLQARMVIDKDGKVGIGTSSPTAKLEVRDGQIRLTAPTYSRLEHHNGTSHLWSTGMRTDEDFYIYRESGAGNVIIPGSKVGIGTTAAPARPLTVYDSGVTDNLVLLKSGAANSYLTFADSGTSDQTGLSVRIGSVGNALTFQTGGTNDRMRIDSSGNVGIGNTAPGAKFHVGGGAGSLHVGGLDGTMMLKGNTGGRSLLEMHSPDGSSRVVFQTLNAGATYLANLDALPLALQTSGGNVGIGTPNPAYNLHVTGTAGKPGGGSWSDSSDSRLKKNIKPLSGALDQITRLNGVTYDWINPKDHADQTYTQAGFIAQEVEKIFPKWVERTDAKGNDKKLVGTNKVRALHFPHSFNAYIVEAIKELKAKLDDVFEEKQSHGRDIASLKAENAELKSEVQMLKAHMCKQNPSAEFCLKP